MSDCDDKLLDIKQMSKRRLQLVKKMGINSHLDLLRFFPRDYEDWTDAKPISQIEGERNETFVGTIVSTPTLQRKGRMTILRATISDYAGFKIRAVWFNQPYYKEKLIVGQKYYFRGKIKSTKIAREVSNPSFEEYKTDGQVGIKPIYRLTAGLTQGVLRNLIANAFDIYKSDISEYLPDSIISQYKLSPILFAYIKIHNPMNKVEYEKARERLVFDELFLVQIGLKLIKESISNQKKAYKINANPNKLKTLISNLPFELTNSQKDVVGTIMQDISSSKPMNRLVQGDVGSGKTVVSAIAIFACASLGYQSVLMAPTFILAKQHYETFTKFFEGLGIKIGLLTGSMTKKEKRDMYKHISLGEIDFIIGTHALIQDEVKFKNLAFAVTDEQHRFGVKQRTKLSASEDIIPHVLVMSATPIPRTLAFVLYGDLDISIIRGLPSGRIPIETYTARSKDQKRIYDLIKKQVLEGHQAYIVTPLIEDGEDMNAVSAVSLYEEIKTSHLKDLRIGLVHGSMKANEKNEVMNQFYNSHIDVLISTTVIEVGVDNPNATIMVIENAEKFGLAQLHQLRGRIGRGNFRSICILKSDSKQEIAMKRLKLLCKTTDGFKLANEDLIMRGIGDFFGTRQHGIPEMKIANLYNDTAILELTKEAAKDIISSDPLLTNEENKNILPQIKNYFGELYENIGL